MIRLYKKVVISVVAFLCVAVFLLGVYIQKLFINNTPTNNLPAEVVGSYDMENVKAKFLLQKEAAYELGLSENGKPVFKDLEKAFSKALIDFADGYEQLENEFDLDPISSEWEIFSQYKNLGWQSTVEDETISEQCRNISVFLDYYENSWY